MMAQPSGEFGDLKYLEGRQSRCGRRSVIPFIPHGLRASCIDQQKQVRGAFSDRTKHVRRIEKRLFPPSKLRDACAGTNPAR
jgi:hypothetical protein